ncbi:MAG: hypothetical protein QOJ91_1516 [Sphingomonadales bacterium]|jgi:hypothetical protein|nr:hypothetical protein [Sphingomonadales bacterium]
MTVIPAKARTSGRKVSAGLPEIPAFAGMTIYLLANCPGSAPKCSLA